jgi:hypothetical protein
MEELLTDAVAPDVKDKAWSADWENVQWLRVGEDPITSMVGTGPPPQEKPPAPFFPPYRTTQ